MLYYARGSKTDIITPQEVKEILNKVFDAMGVKNRVLALPPDHTRLNSFAGPITEMIYGYFGDKLTDIMPALGTHAPMTDEHWARHTAAGAGASRYAGGISGASRSAGVFPKTR